MLRVHRTLQLDRHNPEGERVSLFFGRRERLELECQSMVAAGEVLLERRTKALAIGPGVRFMRERAIIELDAHRAPARIEVKRAVDSQLQGELIVTGDLHD